MPFPHRAFAGSRSAAIAERLQTAQDLCQQRGTRLTPIRRKVLEILLRQDRSLKAYELLDEVRRIQSNATPPTVYRALDFLSAQGLIHRLDAVNAWTACRDARGAHHDLLIICVHCGVVVELSEPELSARLAHKAAQVGFVLASPETELRALCQTCAKGEEAPTLRSELLRHKSGEPSAP